MRGKNARAPVSPDVKRLVHFMEALSLKERIAEITKRSPKHGRDYYFVRILGKSNGDLEWYCYSHWVGFADEERRIELREASIVNAEGMCNRLRDIGESCAVVDDLGDMELFFLIGGNALVEKGIGELTIKKWLDPRPVAQSGARGFACVESLPKGAFNKAPTSKQRMQVLKRDDYRCKICGRRPTDYVDVQLHVHHIRPWAKGGLTEGRNLITLCHTCHKGLEPHFDPDVFELLEPDGKHAKIAKKVSEYWQGVKFYREKVVREYSRGEVT